jgi:hypothetical protein
MLISGQGVLLTEDFNDAPVIVPGQLAEHHYQFITTSKKGRIKETNEG